MDETPDYDYQLESMCVLCGQENEDCECEIGEECPTCEGTGVDRAETGHLTICPTCEGRTYVPHGCSSDEFGDL